MVGYRTNQTGLEPIYSATEPILVNDETVMWYDTSDGNHAYLLSRDSTGTQRRVDLTQSGT